MPKPSPVLKLKPVSIWKRDVGVDFGGFFANLGDALFSAGTGNPFSAFKSLFDASRAVKLKELKPDEAAAVLVGRAIQRATVRLLKDSGDSLRPGVDARQALKEFKPDLADADLEIDQDFLRNPPRFEVLVSLESALQEWLVCSGARAEEAASMAQRLHPFFVDEFHDEWASRRDAYSAMEDYFELPSSEAAGRQRAWDRYNAKLQKQIDESVLGQSFSLRQTYVPLRAYWTELAKEETGPQGAYSYGKVHTVVELSDDLDRWIKKADPEEAIRMISGGPGSGKSSAAKMFAARMSDRSDLHVVWVPLHHFSFEKRLETALADFCSAPGMPPADFLTTSGRTLLIFDGLDELALAGRASQEMAKAFVAELIRLVGLMNRDGLTLQALLSGREVAIQEYAAELRRSRTLVLLGHYPEMETGWFDQRYISDEDRRDQWWEKYRAATGKGPGSMPAELNDSKLRDLTSQPLLTVLLAIVWDDRGNLDLTTPWALNDLYATLLGHVYERKWGVLHPSQRVLSKDKYLRVLEEVAIGAWHSGEARQVSRRQIMDRCRRSGLGEELNKFSEAANEGVTQLLTAFYFRKTDTLSGDGEVTFEFTHKSFAEYLVARRTGAVLAASNTGLQTFQEDVDQGKSPQDLLLRWTRLVGPERMGENVVELVRGEILRRPESIISAWHETLERMLRESVHRGMPMEIVGLPSFREMKRQARNAELALAVCTATAAHGSGKQTDVRWEGPDQALDWVNWLSFGRLRFSMLVRKGLRRMLLRGINLAGASLERSNFDGADLTKTDLTGADLAEATAKAVRLDFAQLSKANLSGAILIGASLVGANLSGATFDGVDLSNSSLVGADLHSSGFSRFYLKGADLAGSNLTNSKLSNGSLAFANLGCANLCGAELIEVDLRGASLDFAKIDNANLDKLVYDERTQFKEVRGTPRNASPELMKRIEAGRKKPEN